ncbi:MAG: hypothetical protein ACREI9_04735 [Nitrospiraceae bacterium]
MLELVNHAPVGDLLEEVSFNLGAGAGRNGVAIDGRDWYGSSMADFTDNRKPGFPLLDLAIRPPGTVSVIVQYAVPTFPIAEPPVLAFTDFLVTGVPAATWGTVSIRLQARFSRVRILDTSGAANNGIYLVYFLRGQ